MKVNICYKKLSNCMQIQKSALEKQKLRISYHIALGDYRKTIKGALSGLRQFFATESPLKMMKNDFYFSLKALCLDFLFM